MNIKMSSTFKQRGFTLVELLTVLAIIAILMALAQPFVRDLLIEGRVDPTAQDVAATANVIRAQGASSGSATPYSNLGSTTAATAAFANAAMNRAQALTVSGAGSSATITHGLGASGSQLTVAQGTVTNAGDAFTVTFPTVAKAACPGLATQLNRTAVAITVNGTAVKSVGGAYNATNAQNACTAGDTNEYVFTFQ
jgi:type IV pilus assembly protein PilA